MPVLDRTAAICTMVKTWCIFSTFGDAMLPLLQDFYGISTHRILIVGWMTMAHILVPCFDSGSLLSIWQIYCLCKMMNSNWGYRHPYVLLVTSDSFKKVNQPMNGHPLISQEVQSLVQEFFIGRWP